MPDKSYLAPTTTIFVALECRHIEAGKGKREGPRLSTAGMRTEDTADELLSLVTSSLDGDKAEDIVTFNLQGKSSIADFIVIASGRSTRQVAALADKLIERVKQAGYGPVRVEGQQSCDWIVVDAGDVVIHLFRPEVRDFYNLEKLWGATAATEGMFDDAVPAGSADLKSPTMATAH